MTLFLDAVRQTRPTRTFPAPPIVVAVRSPPRAPTPAAAAANSAFNFMGARGAGHHHVHGDGVAL